MKKPDKQGLAAFPSNYRNKPQSGMSLRDFFAANALCGYIMQGQSFERHMDIAREAYQFSDCMLKVRRKKSKEEQP